MSEIRSVRNNNPGNIRVGANWQGLMLRGQMTPEQAAEHDFCVFQSPVWGFRAMAQVFHTYHDKDGIRTIGQAITRWAPPNENDTASYIRAVCAFMGRMPADPFDFHDPAALARLLQAVSIHEAGGWYFQAADALAGAQAAH